MDRVRLGVVGLGNIGAFHVKYLRESKIRRVELVAACDADQSRFAACPGIEAFCTSEELIRSGKVDAVLISTPHFSHTTIGIDALQHGLHVLVEKPISAHKADAERLIAAHTNPRQVFAAMFMMRTRPQYRKIKQLIDTDELGEIQRINWIITDWFRPNAYYASGGWRATWRGEGGGLLLNQCPHNLDLLQWLCGMPVRLRAFCGFGKRHDIEVEDEVTAYLEYANGATGVFVATTGEAPGTNRLEIAGDRGRLVLEGGKLAFIRNEISAAQFCRESEEVFGKPPVWHVDIPVEETPGRHEDITQNFVDAILDEVPLVAPAEEGIRSVELANAMIYSSLKGETVALPLDGSAYEQLLNRLIANSSFHRKTASAPNVDVTSSFSR